MDQSMLTLPFAGVSGYTIHELTTDLTSLMSLLVDPAGNILIADVDGKTYAVYKKLDYSIADV
ncbi:hypothetical protein B0H14DRAFT_3469770 [Mycena olivaceomarginata]|nr:hypothetical protein B0H14DRAFT_3469770 [Mycena olivaceomarginata]